jgi:hypothetical protein
MAVRIARIVSLFVILVTFMVLGGCQTVRQAYHDVMDTYETYPPAPRSLDASIEDTGLFLVYADMEEQSFLWDKDLDLEAISITKMDDPSNPIIVSDFSLNMVVFHGLEPGVYLINSLFWVRDIETDSGTKETKHFEKKVDDIRRISVKIEAGVPYYVGKLIYMDTDDEEEKEEWNVEVDKSPEFEIEAWTDLKKRYGNSDWIPLIDRKVQELSGENNTN